MNRAKSLPVMTLAARHETGRRARKASLRSDSVRKAITGVSARERRSPTRDRPDRDRPDKVGAFRELRKQAGRPRSMIFRPGGLRKHIVDDVEAATAEQCECLVQALILSRDRISKDQVERRRHLTSDEDRCVGTNEFYKRGTSPKNSRATAWSCGSISTLMIRLVASYRAAKRCQHRSPCRSPECGHLACSRPACA